MPEPRDGEEGTEHQVEQNAPDPLDYYDRPDESKARGEARAGGTKSKEVNGKSSRFQRYIERAKAAIDRAKPVAVEVGKYIKDETPTRVARLVAKETVFGAVPGVNLGLAGYDVYRFGKDIYHVTKEAREVAAKQSKKEARPFHEVAQQKRELDLRSLESRLKYEESLGKREYWMMSDSWQHPNEHGIAKVQGMINGRKALSLEEQLSLKANAPQSQAKMASRFAQAEKMSQSFQREYLTGSVFVKYDHFLAAARKELGDHYFDLSRHPQRGIDFDRFAAERLYADGFSKSEVTEAIRQQSPFKLLLDDKQSLQHSRPVFIGEYEQKILDSLEKNVKDVDRVRENVRAWQLSQGQDISRSRINPYEHDRYQALKAAVLEKEATKKAAVNQLSREVLSDYKAKNAQDNYQGPDYQYLLERGRVLEARQEPNDLYITFKLHTAGYSKAEIVDVLHQFSPHSNDGVRYGHQKYEEFQQFLKQPDARASSEYFVQLKQDNPILQSEHRLDRLGLSYDQFEGKVQSGYTDKANSATTARSQDSRDIEIER